MVRVKKGLLGELDSLHRRMERIMESVMHRGSAGQGDWFPPADLYETDSEVIVVLEVAGIDPETLDVTLEENMLRVLGRRKELPVRRSCMALHQMEIEYGPFERLFSVPSRLDGDGAIARLDNGFLEIRIPKLERSKEGANRVEIKTQ